MDINRETRCPHCDGALTVRELPGADSSAVDGFRVSYVVLGCPFCPIEAVVGDDRFLPTQDVPIETRDGKLRHRAERIAEDRKRAEGRYTEVKR